MHAMLHPILRRFQSVIPCLAANLPVIMLALDGLQTRLAAYPWVKTVPLIGDPVNVRGFVKAAAGTAQIMNTKVIGQDENYIRPAVMALFRDAVFYRPE